MNNKQSALQLLDQAKHILFREIPVASQFNNHRLVVRRSQEVVELVIKAFIKHAGYDYPKIHDPSQLIERISRDKGLVMESDSITRICEASSALAEERSPAFYAERSYGPDDARDALAKARWVFDTLACHVAPGLTSQGDEMPVSGPS